MIVLQATIICKKLAVKFQQRALYCKVERKLNAFAVQGSRITCTCFALFKPLVFKIKNKFGGARVFVYDSDQSWFFENNCSKCQELKIGSTVRWTLSRVCLVSRENHERSSLSQSRFTFNKIKWSSILWLSHIHMSYNNMTLFTCPIVDVYFKSETKSLGLRWNFLLKAVDTIGNCQKEQSSHLVYLNICIK